MLTDFLPHKPDPRRWFASERTELSAMKRPAAAATLLLALLFVFQFGFLCWCNLTQWQSHLDGDSSSQILKVMEIYKAGSLSLPNWNDTTSLLLDTPLILAAFLMPLFRDPFTAYGAGNILLLIMLVYVVWQLLRRVDCAPALRLVAILLLLCPYGHAEVLGYANCMVVQSAHYLMRVIYLLYLLYCLVFLERGEKSFGHLVSCLFTLGLGAWTAMSSGLFLLLIVFLPVAAGWALRVFAANQPGLFKTPGALFLVLNFLGFGAGYFVQRNVIHFSSRDSVIAWNSYSDFLPNLSKVIQGYFKLTGALPESGGVTILSGSGIAYGFAFAVALLLIGSVWFCLARICRTPVQACTAAGRSRGMLFACLLCIVGVDCMILTGAALAYGEETYESRYLIFMLVAAALLVALCLPWLRRLGGLYAPVLVATAVLVVGNTVFSDAAYVLSPTYDFSTAIEVTSALDEAYPDVKVVYMVSDDHDRKVLRVADDSKVYRMVSGDYNPGDYTYYTDGSGLEAGSLLLATDAQYAAMPEELSSRFVKTDMPQFWLYLDKTGYSTNDPQPYSVYYCADGGIDLTSLPVTD